MSNEESSWSKRDCVRLVLRGHRLFHNSLREGEPPSDERFVESFDELLPELRDELTKSNKVSRLREQSSVVELIFPRCSSRISLPKRTPKQKVVCQACSNTFEADEQSTLNKPAESFSGKRIGQFLLIDKAGKGGFGTVWKALDTTLHRTVAVKVATRVDDDDDRQRFLREAESAAKLKHPHIVEVFQSGELLPSGDSPGVLYIVSRFVEGRSLYAEMARERIWNPRRAAELLLKLAEAIHHAHENDVIHRDIKPANILIDAAGEPHITDFGLAKQLTRDTVMTQEGMILGSPAYMSPEQAAGFGHEVGPPADLYSLGAILYELLSGQKTFVGSDIASVLRQVQEDLPLPVRRLNNKVPVDLDTICMKCLQKMETDRFVSAADLADELRRYLNGEPIKSRPVGPLTIAVRWCQRKPMLASLLGALVSTVAIAVVAISLAWVSERAAHGVAERRRQETVTSLNVAHESLGGAYLRLGAAFKLFPEMNGAYAEFLQQGAQQYEQLAAVETDDPDLQLERGRVWLVLGDIRQELGDWPASAAAYRAAEKLLAKHVQASAAPVGMATELANTKGRLAALAIRNHDDAAAEKLCRAAVDELSRLHREQPADAYREYSLAAAHLNYGGWLLEKNQSKLAIEQLEPAADHFEKLMESRSHRAEWLTDYVRVLTLLGHHASREGQHDEAIRRIESGLRKLQQLEASLRHDVRFLETRSASHVYLAQALDNAGRTDEALAEHAHGVTDLQALSRLAPTVTRLADEWDLRQVDFAQALYDAGQLARAEQELNQVLSRLEEVLLAAPDDTAPLYASGLAHDALARALADKGELDTASGHAEKAVAAFQRLSLLAESPASRDYKLRLSISQIHRGEIAHQLGDEVSATKWFDEADHQLALLRAADPAWEIATEIAAFSRRARGLAAFESGQVDAARKSFAEAMDLWTELTRSGLSPRYQNNLAWFLIEVPLDDLRAPQRAVELAEVLVKNAPSNVRHQALLGAARCAAGDFAAAVQRLETIPETERRARDWLFLSQAQAKLSRDADALRNYRSAVAAIQQEGPNNPALKRLERATSAIVRPDKGQEE